MPGGVRAGVPPHKKLVGTFRWMGSHFHDRIDYNGGHIFNRVTRMGSHIFGFLG